MPDVATEHSNRELKSGLRHPAARLVALIGLVVLLFAIALGVSIWRYGVSHDSNQTAIEEEKGQVLGQRLSTLIAKETGLGDAYRGDKDPADLRELDAVEKETTDVSAELHRHLIGEGEIE